MVDGTVWISGEFFRYALIWIQGVALCCGMNLAMESKLKGWKKHFMFPVVDICVVIFADQYLSGYLYLQMFIGTGMCLLYGILCYKEKLSRKLIYSIGTMLLGVVIEYLLSFYLMYQGMPMSVLSDYVKSPANSMMVYATFLYVVFNITLGLCWRIYIKRTISYSHKFFFYLPVSQILLIYCLHPVNYKASAEMLWNIAGVLFIFAADCFLFIVLCMEIRRQELEQKLKDERYQRKLEEEYYLSLENRILPLEKICHDCNNQLLAIYYLMEQNEWDHAKKLAGELEEQLQVSEEG